MIIMTSSLTRKNCCFVSGQCGCNFALEFEGMSRILGHVLLLSLLVDVSLSVDELFSCGSVVLFMWLVFHIEVVLNSMVSLFPSVFLQWVGPGVHKMNLFTR